MKLGEKRAGGKRLGEKGGEILGWEENGWGDFGGEKLRGDFGREISTVSPFYDNEKRSIHVLLMRIKNAIYSTQHYC